jgi:hypothetical protein
LIGWDIGCLDMEGERIWQNLGLFLIPSIEMWMDDLEWSSSNVRLNSEENRFFYKEYNTMLG